MARPTKYNEQTHKRICTALSAGNTRKDSAEYAGVSEATFGRWIKEYPEFEEDVQKAEADAVVRNVAIIQQAASKTWQAAAWWLERRRKNEWSAKTEVGNADGEPMKIVVEYVKNQ